MTSLIKIGNAQGIKIPKNLIAKAKLANKELKLVVVESGLLVTPARAPRKGWDITPPQEISQDYEVCDVENVWEW